jgi:hypothetical protein
LAHAELFGDKFEFLLGKRLTLSPRFFVAPKLSRESEFRVEQLFRQAATNAEQSGLDVELQLPQVALWLRWQLWSPQGLIVLEDRLTVSRPVIELLFVWSKAS